MRMGTRSILFGVHQFIIHPILVYISWLILYKELPNIRETICIIIHDLGYWGMPDMDGEMGTTHPLGAARIAGLFFGSKYRDLCLYHSRHYARIFNAQPSKLCWADKYSVCLEVWWTYLPRAWITGELKEYRQMAADASFVSLDKSNREWFKWAQSIMRTIALSKKADVVKYMHEKRSN